jgi:hypothetical protein
MKWIENITHQQDIESLDRAVHVIVPKGRKIGCFFQAVGKELKCGVGYRIGGCAIPQVDITDNDQHIHSPEQRP